MIFSELAIIYFRASLFNCYIFSLPRFVMWLMPNVGSLFIIPIVVWNIWTTKLLQVFVQCSKLLKIICFVGIFYLRLTILKVFIQIIFFFFWLTKSCEGFFFEALTPLSTSNYLHLLFLKDMQTEFMAVCNYLL